MFTAHLFARVHFLYAQAAHETAGAARTRHSLRPLLRERGNEIGIARAKRAARSRTHIRRLKTESEPPLFLLPLWEKVARSAGRGVARSAGTAAPLSLAAFGGLSLSHQGRGGNESSTPMLILIVALRPTPFAQARAQA